MKIQHLELIIAALSVALLVIAWSLLRSVLSSRFRAVKTARSVAAGSRAAAWRQTALQRLRLSSAAPHAGVARLRKLQTISEHDNGVLAGQDGGYASLTRQIEARLELAFEQFSRGRISIHTYRSLVGIEADLIAERIAEANSYWPGQLDSESEGPALDADLSDAMALVRWCLDWADDMVFKLGAEARLVGHPSSDGRALQTA
jgi:hypothetical protein